MPAHRAATLKQIAIVCNANPIAVHPKGVTCIRSFTDGSSSHLRGAGEYALESFTVQGEHTASGSLAPLPIRRVFAAGRADALHQFGHRLFDVRINRELVVNPFERFVTA